MDYGRTFSFILVVLANLGCREIILWNYDRYNNFLRFITVLRVFSPILFVMLLIKYFWYHQNQKVDLCRNMLHSFLELIIITSKYTEILITDKNIPYILHFSFFLFFWKSVLWSANWENWCTGCWLMCKINGQNYLIDEISSSVYVCVVVSNFCLAELAL